jgi:hypothetical protein
MKKNRFVEVITLVFKMLYNIAKPIYNRGHQITPRHGDTENQSSNQHMAFGNILSLGEKNQIHCNSYKGSW